MYTGHMPQCVGLGEGFTWPAVGTKQEQKIDKNQLLMTKFTQRVLYS